MLASSKKASCSGAATVAEGTILSQNIAEAVIRFLDFDQYCYCTSVSSAMHCACGRVLARTEELKVVKGSRMEKGHSHSFTCFSALRILDVSQVACDELLRSLTGLLPNLSVLQCVSSPLLTDAGVASLYEDGGQRSRLETIDLTFCMQTSYRITLQLRRSLPGLKLIRRQPAYLDGHFITPFGGSSAEVHTYYADGSFEFSRRQQSRGYVRFLEEKEIPDRDGESFLIDSLQYCNFDARDMGWPEFTRFLYRPGVALRPGRRSSTACSAENSILVAQNLMGMVAPTEWPSIPDNEVPLGQSIYFDEAGQRLQQGLSMREATESGALSLISRMPVRVLESLMPPPSLVHEIETFERMRFSFEEHMQQEGHDVVQMQMQLQLMLERQ